MSVGPRLCPERGDLCPADSTLGTARFKGLRLDRCELFSSAALSHTRPDQTRHSPGEMHCLMDLSPRICGINTCKLGEHVYQSLRLGRGVGLRAGQEPCSRSVFPSVLLPAWGSAGTSSRLGVRPPREAVWLPVALKSFPSHQGSGGSRGKGDEMSPSQADLSDCSV